MILVDTNVLGRLCHFSDPLRAQAVAALLTLRKSHGRLVLAPQVCYEFWVTATRPSSVNGLGMTVDRATRWLDYFHTAFEILRDPSDLLDRWEALIRHHRTVGKAAHDARLVAFMQAHGLSSILTFNSGDFARYGITVIDPRHLPTA
jgi:predicted nucleic acid-binding protein